MGEQRDAEQRLSVHLAGIDYLTTVGLKQLFAVSGFIDVAGLSATGTETVEHVQGHEPDVVLIDALISHHGLLETMSAICRLGAESKMVVFSAPSTGESVESLFRAGARGYLLRGPTLEDIAPALRIVHRGGLVNSLAPAPIYVSEFHEHLDPAAVSRFKALKLRDTILAGAVAEGLTNAQISKRMHLSEATVKSRLAQIMNQLAVNNRVQIAVATVKAGMTNPVRR